MSITKGDVIQIVPERGPVRTMRVSHVEHHIITLADPDPEQDWPWQELDELSERLYHFMRGAVGQVMLAAGEDPTDKALFALRSAQVASGIRSRAERASVDAGGPGRVTR